MDVLRNEEKIPSMAARKRAYQAGYNIGKDRRSLRVVDPALDKPVIRDSWLAGFDLAGRKAKRSK